MAKTFTAPFAQAKKTGVAVCTAAKTVLTDATNAVLLATGGVEGTMVRRVTAVPRATVTATQLQLYRSSDGGTTLTLCNSMLMGAYTLATTTAVPTSDFGFSYSQPVSLAPTERLYAAIGVALASGIVFTAELEDF